MEQPMATEPEAVLDRLERVVRWSDEFALAFAKCNSPVQRQEMSQALLSRLGDKKVLEIQLDQPIVSLLDEVTARWDSAHPPDAVFVYGLEHSINEQKEASPVLGRLNHDRDLLRRAIPAPLLIWLPDFALDCMARGAPDFWAWRSGVFEFPTDRSLWQRDGAAALAVAIPALVSLTEQEKRVEIARVEELIRTARSVPRQGRRGQVMAGALFYQLGVLHHSLGEWAKARDGYEQTLQIARELGDKRGLASSIHNLGTLQQDQGNLAEAARLFGESLQIKRELRNTRGVAYSLGQLGMLQQDQGNLAQAARLYEESLRIHRELGDRNGIAFGLHHLGTLQRDQGDLGAAIRLQEESLQIYRELGDKRGIASSLDQLGMVREEQRKLTEAARFYEENLQINRELGDPSGIAISLGKFGLLLKQMNETKQALEKLVLAWTLFRDLRSPYTELVLGHIRSIQEQAGGEQFQVWLAEMFPGQVDSLMAALDEQDNLQPVAAEGAG
jgi:tetratricopeptide (TPR) repeat protein